MPSGIKSSRSLPRRDPRDAACRWESIQYIRIIINITTAEGAVCVDRVGCEGRKPTCDKTVVGPKPRGSRYSRCFSTPYIGSITIYIYAPLILIIRHSYARICPVRPHTTPHISLDTVTRQSPRGTRNGVAHRTAYTQFTVPWSLVPARTKLTCGPEYLPTSELQPAGSQRLRARSVKQLAGSLPYLHPLLLLLRQHVFASLVAGRWWAI